MKHKESPLSAIIKGALSGAVGTVVLSTAVKVGPTLLRQIGINAPEPPAGAKQNEPTEKLAQKSAQGLFDTHLDRQEKKVAGQALHWGYGLGWGALYGIVQSALQWPFMVNGTLLGGAMTLTATTLVPAMGITPPADKIPTNQKAMQTSFIMLFGWTTTLVYHFLSRD